VALSLTSTIRTVPLASTCDRWLAGGRARCGVRGDTRFWVLLCSSVACVFSWSSVAIILPCSSVALVLPCCSVALAIEISLGQKERQTLERDRQVHAFQLDVGRHLQRARRKVQYRLHAARDNRIDDGLRDVGRHGDHGDADLLAANDLAEVADVVDRNA